jgi:hypothetical protein
MTSTNPSQTYLYMLYNEINYNPLCKEYYNILTLNKQPEGTLKEYTKLINIILPSTNQNYNKQCSYAILNSLLNNTNTNTNTKYSNFLMLEDLNEFTEFLINNTYIIDNSITKLYKNNSFKSSNSKKLIYSFKITL